MNLETNYNEIKYEVSNQIASITLISTSPDNKLNHQNVVELISALKLAVSHKSRVIVLTGNTEIFCGGGTIGDFTTMSGVEINAFGVLLEDMIMTMKTLPIPIIGVVYGKAYGGGFSLIEACDIKIAHQDSTFAIPEIGGGFCPAVALVSVWNAFGNAIASKMAMTGQAINATEALNLGLISTVGSDATLDLIIKEQISKVLNGNPTAYRITKEIGFKLSETSLRNGFTAAIGKLVEFLSSDDACEVVMANKENRNKQFTLI